MAALGKVQMLTTEYPMKMFWLQQREVLVFCFLLFEAPVSMGGKHFASNIRSYE